MTASTAPIDPGEAARIAALFAAEPDILLAYLFGSRASGRAVKGSDYDIGIVASQPLAFAGLMELSARLSQILEGEAVDLIDLSRAPIELQYNVVAARVRLFERSVAARVEYESKVYGLYCDALPTLRRQREELIRGEGYARGIQRYREALGATRRKLAALRGIEPGTAG